MVLPVYLRTREMAPELGFDFAGIRAIEPLGFLEFLQLAKGLALPDSGGGPGGGVHSGRSGLTLRENTERPEIRWMWGQISWRELVPLRCFKRPGKCCYRKAMVGKIPLLMAIRAIS